MHLKYIHTNRKPQNSALGSSVYVAYRSCLTFLTSKIKTALWQIKQDHEDIREKCGNLECQLQTFFFLINLTV